MSIPSQPHQNHRSLFVLARALKAIKPSPLRQEFLFAAFELWYPRAKELGLLREGRTKDEYLAELVNAYADVKYPLGEGPAERAFRSANSAPFPPEAKIFSEKASKLLVGLCFQLDLSSGQEPWFLACRTAAELIGMSHTEAAQRLKMLVNLKILKVVQPGTKIKAARYRYCSQS